jgi:coproporphyrinogen III oxidase-like Fe-S oxidoreductase
VVGYSSGKGEKFTAALCREIGLRAPGFRGVRFESVRFSGGPTHLSLDQLYRVLQALYDNLASELTEQAIAVVPGTLDDGRAKVLAESGFDRAELRVSDPDQDSRDFVLLRTARFRTAGVELELSADGREWERRLDAVLRLEPDLIRFRMPQRFDGLVLVGVLRRTRERLAGAGYSEAALHLYARSGHEPAATAGSVVAGFGPGAPTFVGREAWANRPDYGGYVAQAGAGESAARAAGPELRLRWLLPFGIAADLVGPGAGRGLVERGLLERRAGRLHVTDQGALVYDRVVSQLALE